MHGDPGRAGTAASLGQRGRRLRNQRNAGVVEKAPFLARYSLRRIERPIPDNWTAVTACLKGPGLTKSERELDALLASTRFLSR